MKLRYSLIMSFLFLVNFSQKESDMILVEGNNEIKSFYLDVREVTMKEFDLFVQKTGYKTFCEKVNVGVVFNPFYKEVSGVNWRHDIKGEEISKEFFDIYPVTRLSKEDVGAYAKWAGKRLPSKEEWLYAAKGGKKSKSYKYIGGNNPRKVGWFDNNSREKRKKVASLNPNELGLYDMGGNVSEIVLQPNENITECLGGSFFVDKDFFEIKLIHNGWKSTKVGFNTPFSGFRCAKDL